MRRLLIYATLTTLALVKGKAQSSTRVKVDNLVKTFAGKANIPGISVAVMRKNTLVYSGYFGMADIENTIQVNPQTKFRIGSIAKLFTSVAIARLIEEHKINLSDDIRKYVPEYPVKPYTITIGQLAAHMSGIRHYSPNEIVSRNSKQYENLTQALEKFKNDSLLFVPGTSARYSSYGYILLGAMIEKLTGQNFTGYIQRQVIDKAGLSHTMPEFEDTVIPGRGRFYYRDKSNGFTNAAAENYSYKWPAGGYFSTAVDLARFGTELAGGRIISRQSTGLLFTEQKTANGENSGYGIGFRIGSDRNGRRVVHHGGISEGGRSFLLIYPDEEISIALLANVFRAPLFEGEAETIAAYFMTDFTKTGIGFNSTDSFTTVVNKKQIKGRFEINKGKGAITGFYVEELMVADIVQDGSLIRIIAVGPEGIINFWIAKEKNGKSYWGNEKPSTELLMIRNKSHAP